MLVASEKFISYPVMSLQTGGELARTKRAIINPNNLMILAYELSGHTLTEQPSFLLIDDIREISSLGLIVDSSDEFVGLDDIIKLREAYDYHFELTGKKVVDEKKKKLGVVTNYSIEPASFIIKQLIVKRPLLKSFSDADLLIDRTQITEITDTTIVVDHDEREPLPAQQLRTAYANPFRGQTPHTEAIKTDPR